MAFIQTSILRPSRFANRLPDPVWQLEQLRHALPGPPENTAALCREHVLTTFSACPEVAPTARDRERKGDGGKAFFHNSFIIHCVLSEPTAEEGTKKKSQSPLLLNQYLHRLLRGSALQFLSCTLCIMFLLKRRAGERCPDRDPLLQGAGLPSCHHGTLPSPKQTRH